MAIDKEELESFYKEYFSKEMVNDFFHNLSFEFMEKYFSQEELNNHAYEKDVFKIILKLIIENLIKEFDCSKEFYESFALYIFKIHIRLIFKFISELVLKEVAYSNTQIIEFLKYYSQDVIVFDGKRYKVPDLKGEDGLRWSIVSMLGTVKTYIKARDYIHDIEIDKDELQNKIKALYVDNITPIEHNIEVEKEFKALDNKVQNNAQKINILHESLEILKSDDDRLSINQELEELQEERLELREEKKVLLKKRINQSVIFHYEDLLRQLENIHRETKAEYKILEQNEKSFQSIKSALTKALLSKKQLV